MFKSLKGKIISTALSIGFFSTLIGLAVSSFAWFSANKKTIASGMDMRVEVDTNLVDINFKLYKYDFDKKEGVEYVEGTESFNLQLNDFDNFIRERNVNNNNIIRFNVTLPHPSASEGLRNFRVSASLNETVIGDPFNGGFTDTVSRTYRDTTGYWYNNAQKGKAYICNNISNIIYFKAFVYSYVLDGVTHLYDDSIVIDESTPATTYRDATSEFVERTAEATFVTDGSKSNSLQFDLEQVDSRASSVVLYVEYNYNTDLVDSFLANTEIVGAQDIGMMSSRIAFQKDIQKITVSSEGIVV